MRRMQNGSGLSLARISIGPALRRAKVILSVGSLLIIGHGAHAQPTADNLFLSASGRCKSFVIAGTRLTCDRVTYLSMRGEGRGSFLVATETGLLSFSGGSDFQPKLQTYLLNIDSLIRSPNGGEASRISASGVCKLSVSKDGKIFHRITCHATSAVGLVSLDFESNGRPVEVSRVPALGPKL